MNFGLNSIYQRILARVAAEKRWKKAWFIPSITFWPHRSPSLLSPKTSFSAIQKLSGSKWWIRLKYIKGQTLPFSPTTLRPSSPHPMNGLHWNALKWWLNRTNVAGLKWMNEKNIVLTFRSICVKLLPAESWDFIRAGSNFQSNGPLFCWLLASTDLFPCRWSLLSPHRHKTTKTVTPPDHFFRSEIFDNSIPGPPGTRTIGAAPCPFLFNGHTSYTHYFKKRLNTPSVYLWDFFITVWLATRIVQRWAEIERVCTDSWTVSQKKEWLWLLDTKYRATYSSLRLFLYTNYFPPTFLTYWLLKWTSPSI